MGSDLAIFILSVPSPLRSRFWGSGFGVDGKRVGVERVRD